MALDHRLEAGDARVGPADAEAQPRLAHARQGPHVQALFKPGGDGDGVTEVDHRSVEAPRRLADLARGELGPCARLLALLRRRERPRREDAGLLRVTSHEERPRVARLRKGRDREGRHLLGGQLEPRGPARQALESARRLDARGLRRPLSGERALVLRPGLFRPPQHREGISERGLHAGLQAPRDGLCPRGRRGDTEEHETGPRLLVPSGVEEAVRRVEALLDGLRLDERTVLRSPDVLPGLARLAETAGSRERGGKDGPGIHGSLRLQARRPLEGLDGLSHLVGPKERPGVLDQIPRLLARAGRVLRGLPVVRDRVVADAGLLLERPRVHQILFRS